jgi:prevent-host-death family protein
MQVNIFEAKAQLSQLIKSAQSGEAVIIANRGEPVARLVAIEAPQRVLRGGAKPLGGRRRARRPGRLVDWLRLHPLPDYARRSAREIDAAVATERDAWG